MLSLASVRAALLVMSSGIALGLFSRGAQAQSAEAKGNAAAKIDLVAKTSVAHADKPVAIEVTLKDAKSNPARALVDTPIVVEIGNAKTPNQTVATLQAVVKAGSSSAQVSWQPSDTGVLQAKAKAKDRDLQAGEAAFLVQPAKAAPAKTPAPASDAPSGKARKKHKKPRASGRSGNLWRAWSKAVCQPPSAVGATPSPRSAPATGHLLMTVSGRGPEGVAADGVDSAKIDVFYTADDGAAAPVDVRVWFSWSGGEITPQPLVIAAGSNQAQAQWRSKVPVDGTVTIGTASPSLPTTMVTTTGVRFVKPILGLTLIGPDRLSFVEVATFSVGFLATDGSIIANPNERDLAFVSEDTFGRLDPEQVHMAAGALQISTSFVPRSFAGIASIRASTDGYKPLKHQVTITWVSCLILAVFGGSLGGLMRYLRSRGVLYLRLLVGIVIGAFAVLVFVIGIVQSDLSFFPSVIKNNLLSVPVAAFIAGWAGLELLDYVAPFARAITGAR